jgi:predicted HTH transcriptional regulator
VKGYAAGFDGIIGFLDGILPASESVGPALRKSFRRFPQLAIRELVANALIHQDFHMTGTGPLVEVFDDRIEITNPGVPLVEVNRFLDTPPRSRNEALASLTRRLRICEERGSGIDKVISEVEAYHLPPPLFEAPKDFTRVVLFAYRPLADMVRQDRIRACYFHACLCFVNRQPMSNASLRARFGIDEKNSATVSRFLGEAVESGAIVIQNPDEGTKSRRYVPFWAADHPKHAEFA